MGLPGEGINARYNPRLLHTQGRPNMTWIDNIKSWTGLSRTELVRNVEDRHQWRKTVHGAANPHSEDG